jgi:sulfite exporter TauE/SafE
MDLLVVFITGLTTGGLSCLAVQGGLLASSLANQIEQDLGAQSRLNKKTAPAKFRPQIAQPILLFLIAKIIAYTLLGFLLGALGSVLQLTPLMRAVLLGAIGIFMVGNGLRMLKVHPIFRYFVIEPPSALTRYIRRKSKNGTSLLTPLFLGAMTVLIPCGVTQAMMATAVGTGDPLQGAAIMASFTLGASPVFFALAYLATRLGSTLEKYFTRVVAVVVIILGIVSVESGLNLAGSPISITRLLSPAASQETTTSIDPPGSTSGQVITINATNSGYSPKILHAAANAQLTLNLITRNTTSCARAIVFPALNVEKVLPASGQVSVDVPPQERGTVMSYSCSMGMYTGQIVFDL